MNSPYGLIITFTNGKTLSLDCKDIDLNAEKGTLTLYRPTSAYLNVPASHRVFMLRHIRDYSVVERA